MWCRSTGCAGHWIGPAWESIEASRRPDRPGVGHLLRHGASERVLLSGTGEGEAATTLLALARFGGQPVVVPGQQRRVRGMVGLAGSEVGFLFLFQTRARPDDVQDRLAEPVTDLLGTGALGLDLEGVVQQGRSGARQHLRRLNAP